MQSIEFQVKSNAVLAAFPWPVVRQALPDLSLVGRMRSPGDNDRMLVIGEYGEEGRYVVDGTVLISALRGKGEADAADWLVAHTVAWQEGAIIIFHQADVVGSSRV